jgi:hypothetical protein
MPKQQMLLVPALDSDSEHMTASAFRARLFTDGVPKSSQAWIYMYDITEHFNHHVKVASILKTCFFINDSKLPRSWKTPRITNRKQV